MSDDKVPDDSAINPTVDRVPVPPEVVDFYKRYDLAMRAWHKTKGNMQFPIYNDPVTGALKWANRAMRRKWDRLNRSGVKAYVHNYR